MIKARGLIGVFCKHLGHDLTHDDVAEPPIGWQHYARNSLERSIRKGRFCLRIIVPYLCSSYEKILGRVHHASANCVASSAQQMYQGVCDP